jgi:hypothetical protein
MRDMVVGRYEVTGVHLIDAEIAVAETKPRMFVFKNSLVTKMVDKYACVSFMKRPSTREKNYLGQFSNVASLAFKKASILAVYSYLRIMARTWRAKPAHAICPVLVSEGFLSTDFYGFGPLSSRDLEEK